jgi:N-sulfoglucosamine sulfohydrolase
MIKYIIIHQMILLFCFEMQAAVSDFSVLDDKNGKPNILLYITDDQSWGHTSFTGESVVRTPGFDRVAREGIYFKNAFVPAPSCAPCRASILTGRFPWQLEEGALLFGGIPLKYPLFTHLLEEYGYESAMCYKGYWPGNMDDSIYHTHPLGKPFLVKPETSYPDGIADCDYAASFAEFLNSRDASKPFFFWMGISEPHRAYSEGVGERAGLNDDQLKVPAFLPDVPLVRNDLLDYFYEIEHQDMHLVRILELLEQSGDLEKTIVIVTSDNGMPFPRAKATLYEYGTHVPLAIRWGRAIHGGRIVEDIVSLTDIGPTILDIAGIDQPSSMTGKSLKNVLLAKESGLIDPNNDFTVTAFERHSWARKGGLTYPIRALRTQEWLLIHNFRPERWPSGDPPPFVPIYYKDYGDVDQSPTKRFMIDNRDNKEIEALFVLAFDKREEFELYHIPTDPENLNNRAGNPESEAILTELKVQLASYLESAGDPVLKDSRHWDSMPFYQQLGKEPYAISHETHPHLF